MRLVVILCDLGKGFAAMGGGGRNSYQMNIAVAVSSLYSRFLPVLIASVVKNNQTKRITFLIFYVDKRVERQIPHITRTVSRLSRRVELVFLPVPASSLDGVRHFPGWAPDGWSRWAVLDLDEKKYERVLVLGVDTLVVSDISEFYNQDMGDFWFAAIEDMYASPEPTITRGLSDLSATSESGAGLNGDVVLVNLARSKQALTFSGFLEFQETHEFSGWDQDIIGISLRQHLKMLVSYAYNYFPNINRQMLPDSDFFGLARIIHFCGGPKPWNVNPRDAPQLKGVAEWWEMATEHRALSPGTRIWMKTRFAYLDIAANFPQIQYLWRSLKGLVATRSI